MVRRFPAAPAVIGLAVAGLLTIPGAHARAAASPNPTVAITALDHDVRAFLDRELGAHLGEVHSLDPAPSRVFAAQTTGEYTWGTFMRSLAAYAQLSDATSLAGKDLARTIGEVGLLEVRLGGTRFSQLYAALSLRHYGTDLSRNRLWQALAPREQVAWTTLMDPTRFYDPATHQVINLPENYLGVAARIAAMAWDVKLLKDRALVDSLLDRAAVQFTSGGLYADDALPNGRYDRYSNEYARYVWDAAQIAGRRDLLDAMRPSLRAQMHLWWDLVAPDAYGYPWGRSLGVVSYLDTLEIAGFLAVTPEFRPAPLDQLASAYARAWAYLRSDYKDDAHTLSVFDFGRGNYKYITREREWQQTVGFLGKLAQAHQQLMTGVRAANLSEIPSAPALPDVARFEPFARGDRPAGVWVVRQGRMQFALPITTATEPGVADYLPAPHGLPGFAVPVEQVVPALVPFLELDGATTILAADGADAIDPSGDGRRLRARWTRWARIGGKPAERVEPGLTSEVEWRIDGSVLTRVERLTAARPIRIHRWWVSVPTTGDRWETLATTGARTDTFSGREGRLRIALERADWPFAVSGRATGDTADGRGARGWIPFHLTFEATEIDLQPGTPRAWTLRLQID